MSALAPRADIQRRCIGVRFAPASDIRTAAKQHGLVDEIVFIAPRKSPETVAPVNHSEAINMRTWSLARMARHCETAFLRRNVNLLISVRSEMR
jgi:hypothetical protein